MVNHKLLKPDGILILEPNGPLEAADFENLAHQLDPYIAEQGQLHGLLIHASKFPGWVNFDAFRTHLHFIEHHIQHVQKVAFVSDNNLLAEVPKIAGHLVRAEVKHFPESEYEHAMQWLKVAVVSSGS